MEENYRQKQQKEVDKNFDAFQKKVKEDKLDNSSKGKFALMKNGKIIDYFNTWEDANKAGEIAYEDKLFSIQEVSDEIINLGYYSYAVI